MSHRSFVHLHCHTHYSLLDGASRIPELVQHVKSLGMNAVAMTDHGTLSGAIEFYRECKAAGINPVIGYEAYVAPGKRSDRNATRSGEAGHHLTLLAKNRTGFKNLIKMASVAYLEGFHYKPRIDKELLEAHAEGLICLSGCAAGEFSDFILKDDLDGARAVAERFQEIFGEDFYIEIMNNSLTVQKLCLDGAVAIANRMGLPLVATSDAHYLKQEHASAHDVLLCINTGKKLTDEKRLRYGNDDGQMVDQFFVRGPQEMYTLFPDHAAAVQRSQEIADGVDIDLTVDLKARHFPVFTPPAGKTPDVYLCELCEKGLMERYRGQPSEAARQRLEHELGIICGMGFASYFLIVGDFVHFAAENGIPASARGSACGALVSYVLKLTHIDPLEYDLLFERFLDPSRGEAPDIDIDFCQDRRDQVIQYVKQKYGEASVAQIATFGTLGAKAVIKDVGRVMDIPLDRVNKLTSLVPQKLGITLADALRSEPELKREYDTDADVKRLIDIALKLEGTNRLTGIHAAGVVISNGPLTDHVPLQRALRKGEDGKNGEVAVATQWVMGDLEKVGLLKMDFLGLRTLTLLDNAVKLIEKTRGEKLDVYNLPLDDPETYALLQRGDAKGVFQFESEGIRELLKRMKPDNIHDIIACTALFRPGPMQGGMHDAYVNRKHGREPVRYIHPVMEEVLSGTYNIMVFQEQVMLILNKLGGIELSSAYACIKAISKKKHDVIDERRAEFIAGAGERGLDKIVAEEIFDLIVHFGGYGFNKCLAGSTTIVDAQTGERATVEDLFRNRRPFVVHSLDSHGRLQPQEVADVVWNGRKQVSRLTTWLGNTITATANHPFRTLDGWTNLEDLKPGDRIAAPRRMSVPGDRHWPRHEIVTLAGLLSEGNTCHPTCLYFYNNDPVMIQDFVAAVTQFPESVGRIDHRRTGRMEVCVSSGMQSRFVKGMKPWNTGRRKADPCSILTVKQEPHRSGAYRWAKALGILGKKATEKFVPPEVFRLCDEDLELFLGRLWSGDGFVANDRCRVPYYATSSEHLARDVQHLLLRLGIVSGLKLKTFKYRGGTRPGFTVRLLAEGAVEAFLERIAPHCVGRDASLALLKQHLAETRRGLTSKDTVPAEVRRWVDEERQRAGLTWRDLEARSGVSMKEFLGQGSVAKQGFRRSTLARLAAFFASERLADLANSDVIWDRVVAIAPMRVQDTYDLTVEPDHNFVADGLVVHNSHSAAYAVVSYQTAYLKAHYAPEFTAALLSSEIEDGNKRDIMVEHIADAKHMGVEVLAPDVNASEPDFTVTNSKVLFGLTAIKGMGRGASEELVRTRTEGGPFKDFFDLCERIDHSKIGRAALEKVIQAGACDALGNRHQLMTVLPRALQAGADLQSDRRKGQRNLFDALEDAVVANESQPLPQVAEWPNAEKLKYEKEALDFYFSSHPLADHEVEIRRFATHAVAELRSAAPGQEVVVGGMLTDIRFKMTKKLTKFARLKVEDLTGAVDCVMWSDDLARHKDDVTEDRICFVRGSIDDRSTRDEPTLVLNRIMSVEAAQREFTRGLWLKLTQGEHEPAILDAIGRVLQRSPGNCWVNLIVFDAAGKRVQLKLGEDYKVNPQTVSVGELETLLGVGCVKFAGTGTGGRNGR